MTRTALALSPHLDDAVFSCGGLLTTLARAGWHVVVATLFTRSVPDPKGFALACQLDKGLGPDVDYMALRRAEDVAAMLALQVSVPIHVPLPEAPHRGYHSAADLFQAPRPDDTVIDDVRTAVDGLVTVHAPDLILAPQAIGGHVDHVHLVNALNGIDRPIAWWGDFPYATRQVCPAEPFGGRMSGLPRRTISLDRAAMDAREVACLAYASQIAFQFGSPDGLRAKLAEGCAVEWFRAMQPLPV